MSGSFAALNRRNIKVWPVGVEGSQELTDVVHVEVAQ
jgi:hypothetical protein